MKICSRLKKIFFEDESETWQKINKILIQAIILNSALFIFLSIGLVLKQKKISQITEHVFNSAGLTTGEEEFFFNIGGRVFNLSRQILENNKESKLYTYCRNYLTTSEIWVPRNPQLFDTIYQYLVLGYIRTENFSSNHLKELLEESMFYNLGELSAKLNTLIKSEPQSKNQKTLHTLKSLGIKSECFYRNKKQFICFLNSQISVLKACQIAIYLN
ncbi:hypothetical protein BpHYR1_046066 [Brachionus plicatilis]|uniref:Potassium channel tetramerisation-type BTB domain-containing protein n=1 Tax=Brachionus plicatilis TaxID=10195 RepID=A0A3M7SRH0_BRAPC|nr:hypothetical protein BpHYR1_046066 [Brachionus plicatilis]